MTLTDTNYGSGPYGVGACGGSSWAITSGSLIGGSTSGGFIAPTNKIQITRFDRTAAGPIARTSEGQLAKPKQGTAP